MRGANWDSVWQGLQDIWLPVLVIAGAVAAAALLSYFFYRKK